MNSINNNIKGDIQIHVVSVYFPIIICKTLLSNNISNSKVISAYLLVFYSVPASETALCILSFNDQN